MAMAVLDHEHHEYLKHPSHRKLNTNEMNEVDNMLLTNANPTLVAEVLHRDGVPVRVKDLYNRKQKLVNSGNHIEAVQSVLTHPHVISWTITDEHNKSEVLLIQTSTQRKLFANFIVVDNNGFGQPTEFGILATEDQQHIEKFLEMFKE